MVNIKFILHKKTEKAEIKLISKSELHAANLVNRLKMRVKHLFFEQSKDMFPIQSKDI